MNPVPVELIISEIQHDLMECMDDGLKHYKILMDELISSATKQILKDSQLEEYHNQHLKIITKALESSYEEIMKINDINAVIKVQQQITTATDKLVQLLDAEFKNIYLSRNEIQMDAVVAKMKAFTNQADISYDKSVEESQQQFQSQAEISQNEIRNKHKTWKGEALLLFDGLLQENSFQIETFRKHELTCRLDTHLESLLLEYPDQQDSVRLQVNNQDEVSSTLKDPPAGASKSIPISGSAASLELHRALIPENLIPTTFSVPKPLAASSREILSAKLLESRNRTTKPLSTTFSEKVLTNEMYAPATLTSVATNKQALSAKLPRQVPMKFATTTYLPSRSMENTGLELSQTSSDQTTSKAPETSIASATQLKSSSAGTAPVTNSNSIPKQIDIRICLDAKACVVEKYDTDTNTHKTSIINNLTEIKSEPPEIYFSCNNIQIGQEANNLYNTRNDKYNHFNVYQLITSTPNCLRSTVKIQNNSYSIYTHEIIALFFHTLLNSMVEAGDAVKIRKIIMVTPSPYDLRSASKELIKKSFKVTGHSDVRILPKWLETPIQYSINGSKLDETVTLRSNLRLTIEMPQKEIVTKFILLGNELTGRLVVFDELVSVFFSHRNRSNETTLLIQLDEFYGFPEPTFKVCSYQVTVAVLDQLYPSNGIRNYWKSQHILDDGMVAQIMIRIQCVIDVDGVYTLRITESPDPKNVSIKMNVTRTDNPGYILDGFQNISTCYNKVVNLYK